LSRIQINADYDWTQLKFTRPHIAHYGEQNHVYREGAKAMEFSSRLAGQSYESMITAFDGYYSRWGDGVIRYNVMAPWSYHLIQPGVDTVYFTNSRVPNFENGLGVVEEICEVVKADVNIDNHTVGIELLKRPTCNMISPSLKLGTFGMGVWPVTIIYSDSVDIRLEWAVGWTVQFMDPTTGLFRSAGSTYGTIQSMPTATTITFSGAPTDIAANDIVVFADYNNRSTTHTNADDEALQEDFVYIDETAINPRYSGDRWG